jgi:hypothetical protein
MRRRGSRVVSGAIVEHAETLPEQRHGVNDYFPFLGLFFIIEQIE